MIDLIAHHFAIAFALFFVTLWIAVTTLIGALSGWYKLMARFPDRPAPPTLRLRVQSASMGSADLNGVLTLAVCGPGLRIGMLRIMGPFCRPFLVPWTEIAVVRRSVLSGYVTELRFGDPVSGTLRLPLEVAEELARAADGLWPEPRPFQ